MRIVFMGTPDFAVATLDALVSNGHNVVGVITAPDKPAGRGRSLQESAVKMYAMKQNLKVLQPTNLKSESFLDELKKLKGNLQIVVAFRMLPKAVWSMPVYGTFNLHASLLPNYRGAAPINWAIINGETVTGVTTFFIDDKIDTGAIILQEKTTIAIEDTAGTLHDKLMKLGADLVLKTINQIQKNTLKTIQQQETVTLQLAPKLEKETCRINWELSAVSVYNHIRGLSPHPCAWALWNYGGEPVLLKIYSSEIETGAHNLKVGSVIVDKKRLKVAAKDGFVVPVELQLQGKRRMFIQEMLNGIQLDKIGDMV